MAAEWNWTSAKPGLRLKDEASTFLLGSYALEGVMLGVDPYGERLIPIIGLIK